MHINIVYNMDACITDASLHVVFFEIEIQLVKSVVELGIFLLICACSDPFQDNGFQLRAKIFFQTGFLSYLKQLPLGTLAR